MDKDFEIKRTISKEDVPPMHKYRKSKYEGIYTSCKTLKREEGIEIAVKGSHMCSIIRKGLSKRFPRRHYDVSGRSNPKGYMLYIIRVK
jgi:hypothetical protein